MLCTSALPMLFCSTVLEIERGLLLEASIGITGSGGGGGGSGIILWTAGSSALITSRLLRPELVPCLFLRSGFALMIHIC